MAHFLFPKSSHEDYDALDGNALKIKFAEPVPRALSRSRPPTHMGGGALVSPDNMPTKLALHGPKRELPDLINRFGMFFVSRRTIDIFEAFQKDIQYFPVTVFWGDGSDAGQFFFLFTTVLLDAVDRDRTTKRWQPAPAKGAVVKGLWNDELGTKFRFSKELMGDVHFWVDPHIVKGPLVSDALYDALRREKIESFHDTEQFPEI